MRAQTTSGSVASRDQAYVQTVTMLCTRLIAAAGKTDWPDADAVSLGLTGLVDLQWQGILSDKEIVQAGFQDWIRERIPVAKQVEKPAKGTIGERNAVLAS